MTLISAQQPYFFPDFIFFKKLVSSDVFLVADHLKFRKQSPVIRADFGDKKRKSYLSVPIVHSPNPHPAIREVKINYSENWIFKHLRTLESRFNSTPYFEYLFPEIVDIYHKKAVRLLDFLLDLIEWHLKFFDIQTEIYYSEKSAINNLAELKNWSERFADARWQATSSEMNYYSKNLPELPLQILQPANKNIFKSQYLPESPLLILIFREGPEIMKFFK